MSRSDLIPPSPDAFEADNTAEADIFAHDEPFKLFEDWLEAAKAKEPNDPNAMALATVDADGLPDVRMVLLKGMDERGFVFFTNIESDKAAELAAVAKAALLFHWKSLRRQVRVRGIVEPVTSEEADAYFATRARDSQIGAWASDQSREMDGPLALEKRVAEYALKFGVGKVPRPPHWSGYRIVPQRFEFWRDRPFRLHQRLQFNASASGGWTRRRVFP
ncbi:MAG TPA: pyridoxamine 5'-phosphate oxidase [Caulobacteraceae bacterium]|jgi:pyridoxamine 5'-phosphate oxidase|nr:pyridoxamine 5'-phosphate oxidase [Caulobacteraceae bacterium]